jgi:hypothetical protein
MAFFVVRLSSVLEARRRINLSLGKPKRIENMLVPTSLTFDQALDHRPRKADTRSFENIAYQSHLVFA